MKPLVLLTPKYLLHHRPATSALADLTVDTFFNRVIDDGKASSQLSCCKALGDTMLHWQLASSTALTLKYLALLV